ncbi:hypothetical protein J5N97_017126 [Dioscorea zingiberensis]|uniref:BZIP domain-containing protein n=1 Tax=Dioscorea zingiberensis TaxID=325984 RepID=A0A9D5CKU6_9LILI|nr:hypothetical protein J5N97_017126 [Dioscorea zingiberensis]
MRHKAQCSLNSDDVQNHINQILTSISAIDQPLSSSTSSSCSTTNNATPLLGNYNDHKDDVWQGSAVAETTPQEFLFPPGAADHLGTQSSGNIVGDSQSLLSSNGTTAVMQQQHAEWWQYQQEQKQQISLMNSNVSSVCVNPIVGPGYVENHQLRMQALSLPMPRHTLSDSQITVETKQSDECIDKSIQRKQKRKIKNRESAARSRARKQLEEEVTKLTNKNKKLKKQKEEEMATRSLDISKAQPMYQLRHLALTSQLSDQDPDRNPTVQDEVPPLLRLELVLEPENSQIHRFFSDLPPGFVDTRSGPTVMETLTPVFAHPGPLTLTGESPAGCGAVTAATASTKALFPTPDPFGLYNQPEFQMTRQNKSRSEPVDADEDGDDDGDGDEDDEGVLPFGDNGDDGSGEDEGGYEKPNNNSKKGTGGDAGEVNGEDEEEEPEDQDEDDDDDDDENDDDDDDDEDDGGENGDDGAEDEDEEQPNDDEEEDEDEEALQPPKKRKK